MTISFIRSRYSRANMLDSHMALMLLTFIEAGFIEVDSDEAEKCHVRTRDSFIEAVSELASIDNTILSIRATILLANFISMVRRSREDALNRC